MKNSLGKTILPLTAILLLSACLFKTPKPAPQACFRIYLKNCGTFYQVGNSTYGGGEIYIGDTIKFVSCGSYPSKATYTWHFGDSTSLTTTDSVVYHVYKGLTIFDNIYIQENVSTQDGKDSAYNTVSIVYPLASFPGTICHAGASSYGYHFFTNADSTIVLSNMTVITYDSIRASCILINPRTFIIPMQSRISTAGLPYTVQGHGNVFTDPNNGATFLSITDTLNYASGYGYACHDTIAWSSY
jgi:hypothetical protein